jgi:uncharacterized protein
MRYNVAQLLRGPVGGRRQHQLHETIDDLDEDLEPVRPLVGTVTMTRTTQGILVEGTLRTTLRTTCRRCLEPCEAQVRLSLEEEFYPLVQIPEHPLDEVPEENQDEALWIDAHHILDLSEVVRQTLWLTAPMEALCRPDCAGLCPVCGGNRNLGECTCQAGAVDPRWAALQALLAERTDLSERGE